MPAYVALLRGINLGAKRRVAMADLRELLAGLGYDDVRTHLQSGNAVFRTSTRSGAAVESAVEQAIASSLGMEVAVVVRTAAQLAAVVAADPFGAVATDPKRYLVTFLRTPPAVRWLAVNDPETVAPDQFVVDKTHIYLWLPNSIHTSKLVRTLTDAKIGGVATSRNWDVVQALATMAAG